MKLDESHFTDRGHVSHPGKRPNVFKRKLFVVPKTQTIVLTYSLFMAVVTILLTGLAYMGLQAARDRVVLDTMSTTTFAVITSVSYIAVIFLLAYLGLVISHRIAGPVYRLGRHMEGLNAGKPITAIRFRKDDHFPEIAEEYNKLLERLAKAEGTTLQPSDD